MLLLGPPGHGKTCISRNLAKTLVGEDHYTEVACSAVRDDADLFGSRLGGAVTGTYSSDGKLTAFLRERQHQDSIVFLDEFEKIKDLHSALGWDQAKKIYQAFLEPWQEGTLTDPSSSAKGAKICCSQVVWILTSNWGQKEIIKFYEDHSERFEKALKEDDVGWVGDELVIKTLEPLIREEFNDVDYGKGALQALARRIDCYVPFFPFSERERLVVADTELRHRFNFFREPAITGTSDKNRVYGNLHLRHTSSFCEYAASKYDSMTGADSMSRVADSINGKFIEKVGQLLTANKFNKDEQDRILSSNPPIKKGNTGYAPEPVFWAHFDSEVRREKVTFGCDPSVTSLQQACDGGPDSGGHERHAKLELSPENPFDE
jgi:DNA polymerase III delta prime subunit